MRRRRSVLAGAILSFLMLSGCIPQAEPTRDTTSPSGSVTVSGAAVSASRYVWLQLSASDNVAVTQMRIANGTDVTGGQWEPYAARRAWPLNDGVDGDRTVIVQFRDAAGNVSEPAEGAVALDTIPPEIGSSSGDLVATDSPVVVTLELEDAGGLVAPTVTSRTPAGESATVTMTAVGEGSFVASLGVGAPLTYYFTATDLAGNRVLLPAPGSDAPFVVLPAGSDPDGDRVGAADNCPDAPNNDQHDLDGDGVGDPCDPDDDGDGIGDGVDLCPTTNSADQSDADGDGRGDRCDTATGATFAQALSAGMGDDGSIPLHLALDAWSSVVGPIPGGDASALPSPDGNWAHSIIRAVVARYWSLSAEQRAVVDSFLSPTGDSIAPMPAPSASSRAQRPLANLGTDCPVAVPAPATSADLLTYGDALVEAREWEGPAIEAITCLAGPFTLESSGAAKGPYIRFVASNQPDPDDPRNLAAMSGCTPLAGNAVYSHACEIQLFADYLDSTPQARWSTLVHELSHVRQWELDQSNGAPFAGAGWIVEGIAEYTEMYVGGARSDDQNFARWNHWNFGGAAGARDLTLFKSSYSAVGFWEMVAQQTSPSEVWAAYGLASRLSSSLGILGGYLAFGTATANLPGPAGSVMAAEAKRALNFDEFEWTWSPPAWDQGAAVPDYQTIVISSPGFVAIPGAADVSALPIQAGSMARYDFDEESTAVDVITIDATAPEAMLLAYYQGQPREVRLANGASLTSTLNLCTKVGGCTCEDGSAPPRNAATPIDNPHILVAVGRDTGDHPSYKLDVRALTLDEWRDAAGCVDSDITVRLGSWITNNSTSLGGDAPIRRRMTNAQCRPNGSYQNRLSADGHGRYAFSTSLPTFGPFNSFGTNNFYEGDTGESRGGGVWSGEAAILCISNSGTTPATIESLSVDGSASDCSVRAYTYLNPPFTSGGLEGTGFQPSEFPLVIPRGHVYIPVSLYCADFIEQPLSDISVSNSVSVQVQVNGVGYSKSTSSRNHGVAWCNWGLEGGVSGWAEAEFVPDDVLPVPDGVINAGWNCPLPYRLGPYHSLLYGF